MAYVCRSYMLYSCACVLSLLIYKGAVAAECPLIQFTAAPSDRTDTPVGSDVEFSCTVNFDVAMKWYIPGNPSLEKIEGKKCNTNRSNCTYTLSIQNVTEDMNQTSFQCKALDHCIPGDVLYSKTALLTVDHPVIPTPTTVTTIKVVTTTEVATITKAIVTTKMIPVCTNTVAAGMTENAQGGASTSHTSAVMTIICSVVVVRLLLIV